MKVTVKHEGTNIRGITLDISVTEYLVINSALLLYELEPDIDFPLADRRIANEIRERIFKAIKEVPDNDVIKEANDGSEDEN